jgi:hypothetical protein
VEVNLSHMESESIGADSEHDLAMMRRAQFEAQRRSTITAWWYPLVCGGFAAAAVGTTALSGTAAGVATILVVVAVVALDRLEHRLRRSGRTVLRAPAPFRRVTALYAFIAVVVVLVLTASIKIAPTWLLAAVAGVLIAVGTAAYERSYRAAGRAEHERETPPQP